MVAAVNGAVPVPAALLIGGRGTHEFAILRELGVRIVYLDNYVPLRCIPLVDIPVDVALDDWDEVLATARRLFPDVPPSGVLTHVEPQIPLAAFLTDRFGLGERGLSLEAAWNCRDKWRTRQALAAAGVPCPGYFLAHTEDEVRGAAAELGLPVIIKPRNGAGGTQVRFCATADEAVQAAAEVLGPPSAAPGLTGIPELTGTPGGAEIPGGGGVLVEEYVSGPEYAVQTLTRAGRTQIVSIFRQTVTPPPVFVELGYDFPAGLSVSDERELGEIVLAAVAAVGIRDWISHTQVRRGSTGFKVIEVNARRPGGRLVEMTEAVSGVDLVRAATQIALGQPVSPPAAPRARAAGYRSIVFPTSGMLVYESAASLDGLACGVPPIVELEVLSGQPVRPAQHPDGGVYGRIVVLGEGAEQVRQDLERVRAALKMQVIPDQQIPVAGFDAREFKPCC
ncbi:MAG: acetyl-CoA carboxylase biotin carboxylase subunit family protein [Pseudonocardiaceae bacterium]